MGKTESGAIWLNEDMFSAYDYWQFWRNTDDRDVKKFLHFFTEIETNEIDNLFKREANINNLKILLANEATKILHGSVASKKAEQTAKDTFHGKGLGSNLPEIIIKQKDITEGIKILEFLSNNQIVRSKSEARRIIESKGLKINDILVDDTNKFLKLADFTNKVLKISYGKKKHYIVKIN